MSFDACRNKRFISSLFISLVITYAFVSFLNQPAFASEGGSSSYTPGTYGDFSMNNLPPGLYFLNTIGYTGGSLDDYPVDTGVTADLDSDLWFELLQIMYCSEFNVLGGRYFANFAIPVGLNADVSARIIAVSGDDSVVSEQEAETTGLGDIQITPVGIIWDMGYFHFLIAENLALTSGRYNKDKLANMGRNYFSYDTNLGFTWLEEKKGHEISFYAGYMINTRNQATDYRTGNEFHVDYFFAQYLSEHFGMGIAGYYYQQMTDDESPGLDFIDEFNASLGLDTLDGYKSKGAGVGPAIMWSPVENVQIIAKWIHEYHAENRLEGDWAYLNINAEF